MTCLIVSRGVSTKDTVFSVCVLKEKLDFIILKVLRLNYYMNYYYISL